MTRSFVLPVGWGYVAERVPIVHRYCSLEVKAERTTFEHTGVSFAERHKLRPQAGTDDLKGNRAIQRSDCRHICANPSTNCVSRPDTFYVPKLGALFEVAEINDSSSKSELQRFPSDSSWAEVGELGCNDLESKLFKLRGTRCFSESWLSHQ